MSYDWYEWLNVVIVSKYAHAKFYSFIDIANILCSLWIITRFNQVYRFLKMRNTPSIDTFFDFLKNHEMPNQEKNMTYLPYSNSQYFIGCILVQNQNIHTIRIQINQNLITLIRIVHALTNFGISIKFTWSIVTVYWDILDTLIHLILYHWYWKGHTTLVNDTWRLVRYKYVYLF